MLYRKNLYIKGNICLLAVNALIKYKDDVKKDELENDNKIKIPKLLL